MKDIKTLFETAKNSSNEMDTILYIENLDMLFENDPMDYLSNAEYIISSGYGSKQFISFIETYGLPIACYDAIVECVNDVIKRGSIYGGNTDNQKELLRYLENYKEKYKNCFMMFESFMSIDPELFMEKSRGKLMQDHRLAIGVKPESIKDHRLHIIYSLEGDWELTQNNVVDDKNANSPNKKIIGTRKAMKGSIDKSEIGKLRKYGNTDHQSKGQKVLAIIDLDDGKKRLKEATCKGPFNYKRKNPPLFHLKVGEIDNVPSFKSTYWDPDNEKNDIHHISVREGHRIRGVAARKVTDLGIDAVTRKSSEVKKDYQDAIDNIEENREFYAKWRSVSKEAFDEAKRQESELEKKFDEMVKSHKGKNTKKKDMKDSEKEFVKSTVKKAFKDLAKFVDRMTKNKYNDKTIGKITCPEVANYKYKTPAGVKYALKALIEYRKTLKNIKKFGKKANKNIEASINQIQTMIDSIDNWTPGNRPPAKTESYDVENTYLDDYYTIIEDVQMNRNITSMIDNYGILAIPDILITSYNINEAAVDTAYAFLSGYAAGDRELTQWLVEAANDVIHHDAPYMEEIKLGTLENIVSDAISRNNSIIREAVITGDDDVVIEYTEEELNAIQDLISFKEYQMLSLNGNERLNCFNEILSLYEELENFVEESQTDEGVTQASNSSKEISKRLTNLSKKVISSVKHELNESHIVDGRLPFRISAAYGTKDGPAGSTVAKIVKDSVDEITNDKGVWIKDVFLFVTFEIDSRKTNTSIDPKKVRPAVVKAVRNLIDDKTLKIIRNLKFDDSDKYFCWLAFRVSKKYATTSVDTSMVESVDTLIEDVADSVLPMMGLPDGQIVEAKWMWNTLNKKTGNIPNYLGNNHDLGYGEDDLRRPRSTDSDDTLDSSSSSEWDDFKKLDGSDASADDLSSSYDDDKSSSGSSTPSASGVNNYYYYTYNNSLNRNSNSFNKSNSSRDDHSRHEDSSRHDDHSTHIRTANNSTNKVGGSITKYGNNYRIKQEDDVDGGRPADKDYTDPDEEYRRWGESAEEKEDKTVATEDNLNDDTPTSNKDEEFVPIIGLAVSYTNSDTRADGSKKSKDEMEDVRFKKEVQLSSRGDNYSHALVGFDTDLKEMYSFYTYGLVKDNINNKSWLSTDSIYICVMFVKKSDHKRMLEYCRNMYKNKDETSYAYTNLITQYIGKPLKSDKRYICSTFTSYILQCSNPKNLHRDYSRQRPEDITILPRSFYIANIKDQNEWKEKKDEIKRKIDMIYNEHIEEIKDWNNQLPKIMLVNKVQEVKTLDKILDWLMDKML